MKLEELKRTVVALQAHYNNKDIVMPANWQPGDDVMVPVLSQSDKMNLNNSDSDYYQFAWFMTFKKSN